MQVISLLEDSCVSPMKLMLFCGLILTVTDQGVYGFSEADLSLLPEVLY